MRNSCKIQDQVKMIGISWIFLVTKRNNDLKRHYFLKISTQRQCCHGRKSKIATIWVCGCIFFPEVLFIMFYKVLRTLGGYVKPEVLPFKLKLLSWVFLYTKVKKTDLCESLLYELARFCISLLLMLLCWADCWVPLLSAEGMWLHSAALPSVSWLWSAHHSWRSSKRNKHQKQNRLIQFARSGGRLNIK